MPRPPERVLLFRSGRHLRTALDALSARAPGCDVTVVATTAGLAALDDAGVPTERRIVYDHTPFFQPWGFLRSGVGLKIWTQRFDRVCVLWTDPDGVGHANVDQTALVVSPRGFTAITPDGQLIERRTGPVLRREAARAWRSGGLGLLLGLTVFLPARCLRPFRAS